MIAQKSNRGVGNVVLISNELMCDFYEIYDSKIINQKHINNIDRTFRYLFVELSNYNFIVDTEMKGKEMVIAYNGESKFDSCLFFSPIRNSLDIFVDGNNSLNYNFSMDLFETISGIENYCKRIIFK